MQPELATPNPTFAYNDANLAVAVGRAGISLGRF